MNDEECKNELAKNSSIMYDPNIVKAVLINWDDIVTNTYKNFNCKSSDLLNIS